MQVSLIIPIYNVEKYLKKCLDSVVAQTCQPFEVLLIDDGSTDGSGKIARSYAEKYANFHYFYQENKGVSAARNLGLQKITIGGGGYIAFLDSDDWIEPNFFEIMLAEIQKTCCDVVICNFYREGGTQYGRSFDYREGIVTGKQALSKVLSISIPPTPWGKFFRKELFTSIAFKEELHSAEDLLILCQIFDVSEKVYLFDRKLYHYRIREISASHSFNRNGYGNHLTALSIIKESLENKGYLPDLYDDYLKCYFAYLVISPTLRILRVSVQKQYDFQFIKNKLDDNVVAFRNIIRASSSKKEMLLLLLFRLPSWIMIVCYWFATRISGRR